MKNRMIFGTFLLSILLVSSAYAEDKNLRHFMFIGQPNAAAWQYLLENPADRKAEVSGAFKAIGGEVLSYYWGLGDGKNYITVTIPDDNELVQAIYLMRLPSGLLNSYRVIEMMPSEQMSEALKRSRALLEKDTTIKQ